MVRNGRNALTRRPEGMTMALGLLGTKVGMTQIFDGAGKVASVTVLSLGPCPILQIRTPERDKYSAIQLGFMDKPRRKAIRAERGHVASEFSSKRRDGMKQAGVAILEKANCEPQRYIREFRLEGVPPADLKVGGVLTADKIFKE